ncbi:hypothetical protein [Lysobacter gummosus]|uniref:hypothetical protein n=1 Tax=Lysobacter gummosus TaxID=262324 RepID=UPI00362C43CF
MRRLGTPIGVPSFRHAPPMSRWGRSSNTYEPMPCLSASAIRERRSPSRSSPPAP